MSTYTVAVPLEVGSVEPILRPEGVQVPNMFTGLRRRRVMSVCTCYWAEALQ